MYCYLFFGALTSKPYAFLARSWELKKVESVDFFDIFGSSIFIEVRGVDIMRILPRIDERLNKEFISDKIRFSYDGLKYQRLIKPILKLNIGVDVFYWISLNWEETFVYLGAYLNSFFKNFIFGTYNRFINIIGLAGEFVDFFSLWYFKQFLIGFGASAFSLLSDDFLFGDFDFLKNNFCLSTISDLNKFDVCLFIGFNPRFEAPILNIIFCERVRLKKLKVYNFGTILNLGYSIFNCGNNIFSLYNFLLGKNVLSTYVIKTRNLVIIGPSFFQRLDKISFLSFFNKFFIFFKEKFYFYFYFYGSSSLNGFLSGFFLNSFFNFSFLDNLTKMNVSFNNLNFGGLDFFILYLLDIDNMRFLSKNRFDFVIYQGHHGDRLVNYADIVLPSFGLVDRKNSKYFNSFGFFQKVKFVYNSINETRGDWLIFKNLFSYFYKNNNICNFGVYDYFFFKNIFDINLNFYDEYKVFLFGPYYWGNFSNFLLNFYTSNSVTRSSRVMLLSFKSFFRENFYY